MLTLIICWAGTSAWAQGGDTAQKSSPRKLGLELNRLQSVEAGCRATFVFRNKLDADLKDLAFELVLFDKAETVLAIVSVAAGALPAGKTRVTQFDIKAVGCDSVGHILLNGITRCDGEGWTAARCLAAAETHSRAGARFAY